MKLVDASNMIDSGLNVEPFILYLAIGIELVSASRDESFTSAYNFKIVKQKHIYIAS